MKGLDYQSLSEVYRKMGYPFFEGAFNVNLGGFRNTSPTVDEFNDVLFVAYQDDFGRGNLVTVRGTTKPGAYWLGGKMGNPEGTFILGEGYHKSCFKKGYHKQQYQCLVQAKSDSFWGYRDKDKDGLIDYSGKIYKDVTGLNFHTTSFLNNKSKVGAYSAGCQVAQDDKDLLTILPVVFKSMELYGDVVSYALFNNRDYLTN